MPKLGVLVNPDAGLGGRLGFKGSDGRAAEARAEGAVDRAGPRMQEALEHLYTLGIFEATFVTCEGRMGDPWFPENLDRTATVGGSEPSSAEDTIRAVKEMISLDIDLLIYAGGDGTTRDIVSALQTSGAEELPIVGVPSGVKMHSGCFAASTRAAAEVVHSWLSGDLLVGSTEVMDLDEEAYVKGEWKVRLYAEVKTPSSPRWMQGAKQRVEAAEEDEVLEGLARHLSEMMEEDPDLLVIWGSGGTLRTMAREIGIKKTVLGIDAIKGGEIIARDVNEASLLKLLEEHTGETKILLSPMGGQGFLIGRGNLQISPNVLRKTGVGSVLGIATPAKLLTVNALRIDSGDAEIDTQFREAKYLKVLQGYRTTRLVKVALD